MEKILRLNLAILFLLFAMMLVSTSAASLKNPAGSITVEGKRKKKPAKVSQPFREEQGNLYVVVKTKTPYNYLYFPDDGENTYRHNGDQEFMRRGAEEATEKIIDQCVSALVKEIGG